MRRSTMMIGATAASICLIAGACSDDDSAATTTTQAATQETTSDTVDQLPGPFELTTADGTINIAGTVEDCDLIDESSATIKFSGSVQDVTVDASGGTGSVTVRGEFDGVIETAAIDTGSGDVLITGTATSGADSSESTEFRVSGRCDV